MTQNVQEIKAANSEELAIRIASDIAEAMQEALQVREHASLVVSGGRTPIALFEVLRNALLDWSRVFITLADERWVAPSHEDSNEAMVRQHLLQGAASTAQFIGLWSDANTAEEGAQRACIALAQIPRPFDVVILGIGNDSHTASLFPNAGELAAGLADDAPDCLVVTPPDAPHKRISLSKRTLLNSRQMILHLVGDEKWQVYQQAMEDGPIEAKPIRLALHQSQVPVSVYGCS